MRSLIWFLALMAVSSLAYGQTITGACDQYAPGPGGDPCMNTGSATGFFPLTGDIKCVRGTPLCSPTNTSQCGKCTVIGLDGIPFNGTLADGQTWCYQAFSNTLIPCNP
jgi:hypothetical protein